MTGIMATPSGGFQPTPADLERVLGLKVKDLSTAGWGPRTARRFGYYSPDDHYEALMLRLVSDGMAWLDVGCGRAIFPSNPALARLLADRVGVLVGVDPDATLEENAFVHERVRIPIEAFDGQQRFDLVSLRMVAEHVTDPDSVVASLARALKPGGLAVIYTVNRLSPVPLLTNLTPFAFHHIAKRVLWGTESKDTFPTAFRMNTPARLRRLFNAHGFSEVSCDRLDDCRTLSGFRLGFTIELLAWRCLRAVGLGYPEACLLGVYRRGGG
jgi:2-polyprenyl-3-methyl-5-hydroxy-6-metoxy-1,4-benzoquinol methylase